MKRLGPASTILAFALVGCQALRAPEAPRMLPTSAVASRDVTSSPRSVDPLGNNSLHVGYAFNGGWYQLYFTDPMNAASSQRTGGPDMPLVDAIDSARLSVDAALYSLSLNNVRQALIRAHRRGVDVRLVMESDNLDRSDPQALKEAGIPILGDRQEGLMHNKFVIIDRAEVWTGSMNLTDDGAYADRNNLLRLRSTKIAEDYETEFDEMFVDDKFGSNSLDATPYPRVTMEGTPIDIYFSPDDHVQAALLDLLDNAGESIYFMAYSFTSDPLSAAIQRRAKAGVTVSGVMDAGQVDTNRGTEYDALRAAGIDVRLDDGQGLMHHKVIIIDSQILVTGSYNFTASAEKDNDENLLVIYNPEIAEQYLREFKRVYASAQP